MGDRRKGSLLVSCVDAFKYLKRKKVDEGRRTGASDAVDLTMGASSCNEIFCKVQSKPQHTIDVIFPELFLKPILPLFHSST